MKKKEHKRKIDGVSFDRYSCSTSKKTAHAVAKKRRKQGFYARVVKNGNHLCVYTRKKPASALKSGSGVKSPTKRTRKGTQKRKGKATRKR
jgi:hypothetical protein